MAGQIISRGPQRWLVRVFLGRDENGKRRYHNKTIQGTKKDAQKYLTALLREKDLGTWVGPSAITVNEYLNQWLQTAAKPRLRERTYFEYEALLRRYVRPAWGDKRLSEVRPLDVQALYTTLLKRGLSARTIRYTHVVLSSSFKQAVKWRLLALNPTEVVELPKQERKEMRALSPIEASRFLTAATQDRWGIVFLFALVTGTRPSEFLGLQWNDIDFQKGVVTIQRTLIYRRKGGGWYFSEPKTSRSRRSIPLTASLVQALSEHRRKQEEERLKKGPEYQNYDLVFASSNGTPLQLRNLERRHFKPILKRAGLPDSLRLYDLRHSCATLLLAENENPKVVSERLGHASIVLTLDTYSHVLPSMQKSATEKLEKLLFCNVGTL